jgi:hypothetical protein
LRAKHSDTEIQVYSVQLSPECFAPTSTTRTKLRSLEQEFTQQGIGFEPEKKLPIYEGSKLLGFYIPDFIIENKVIPVFMRTSKLSVHLCYPRRATPSNRKKCTRPDASPATIVTPSGATAQQVNALSPVKLAIIPRFSKSQTLRVLS